MNERSLDIAFGKSWLRSDESFDKQRAKERDNDKEEKTKDNKG